MYLVISLQTLLANMLESAESRRNAKLRKQYEFAQAALKMLGR